MNLLAIQGIAFSLIAGAVVAASILFAPFEGGNTLVILAFFILLLGVPHGALDPVFAAQLFRIRKPFGWVYFSCLYLLLAFLVILLWRFAPFIFLAGFLLISLAHFSGDPREGTAWPVRLLYGGAPLILPALLQANETTRIFSFLIDPLSAQTLVSVLAFLSVPWLILLLGAAVHQLRVDTITSLEITAVGVLAVVATPLVSFTVFFCCMHSPRHLLRTLNHARMYSYKRLLAIAFGPLLGIGVLLAGSSTLLEQTAQDSKLIQIIFIGLAALTVPHMVLVEQMRFYGWPKDDSQG
jgi:Brp/Blh family beta-carotene 15,15'-monooxygenase